MIEIGRGLVKLCNVGPCDLLDRNNQLVDRMAPDARLVFVRLLKLH